MSEITLEHRVVDFTNRLQSLPIPRIKRLIGSPFRHGSLNKELIDLKNILTRHQNYGGAAGEELQIFRRFYMKQFKEGVALTSLIATLASVSFYNDLTQPGVIPLSESIVFSLVVGGFAALAITDTIKAYLRARGAQILYNFINAEGGA